MTEVPIHDRLQGAKRPRWLRKSVCKMLQIVPREQLTELESIVFSDSSVLSKRKVHVEGRTLPENRCLSFYHLRTRDRKPWIELVVDNIMAEYPRWMLRLPVIRDIPLSKALFHEIGHHIDAATERGGRGSERSAKKWEFTLGRSYFVRRYWYLRPVVVTLVRLCNLIRRRSHAVASK